MSANDNAGWSRGEYAKWFGTSRAALMLIQGELRRSLEAGERGNYELAFDCMKILMREVDFITTMIATAVAKRDASQNGENAA